MAGNRYYRDWQSGDTERQEENDRYGRGSGMENERQGARGAGRGRDPNWGSGSRWSNENMGRGWQDEDRGGSYGSSRGSYGSESGSSWGSDRDRWGQGQSGGYGYGGYGDQSRGSWGGSQGSQGQGYGGQTYGGRGQGQGWRGDDQRGLWDRATDEVSSWFVDRDAERRREMDQHRGRGPKNYKRSDERIREDVCDRLSDDGMVDASEIEVKVSGAEVTLDGTVNSRDQRRRAEECTERVSGVTHVQNNLRVKNAWTQGSSPGQSGQWGQTSGSTSGSTASGTMTGGTTSTQQYRS